MRPPPRLAALIMLLAVPVGVLGTGIALTWRSDPPRLPAQIRIGEDPTPGGTAIPTSSATPDEPADDDTSLLVPPTSSSSNTGSGAPVQPPITTAVPPPPPVSEDGAHEAGTPAASNAAGGDLS